MAHPLEADGYQVRRWLGQSVRGPSYEGVDPDGVPVAIKALDLPRLEIPPSAAQGPEFQKLTRAIKSIFHPGLARVRDIVLREGTLFVVEEFFPEAVSLHDVIERQRFIAPEAAWKLACQLCHGLHFLHERGILNLRLRPENILIGHGGPRGAADRRWRDGDTEQAGPRAGPAALGRQQHLPPLAGRCGGCLALRHLLC